MFHHLGSEWKGLRIPKTEHLAPENRVKTCPQKTKRPKIAIPFFKRDLCAVLPR